MTRRKFSKKWAGLWAHNTNSFAPGEEIRFDTGKSVLGELLVAMTDSGVVAILVGESPKELAEDLQERFPAASVVQERLDGGDIVAQVARYIDAPHGILDLPLELRGTAFQKRVWNAVRTIPAGRTSSYSEIARRIGAPRAVRAVGSACASNNLAFAVPCHRVLHKDGSMSWGEAWGKARQQQLLAREAVAREESMPRKLQRRKSPRGATAVPAPPRPD
jgi:AraC family transcriptional regulator, regulatory protein of adaptative response / methylated-DNA-[protein]-cysteine methyltransferase